MVQSRAKLLSGQEWSVTRDERTTQPYLQLTRDGDEVSIPIREKKLQEILKHAPYYEMDSTEDNLIELEAQSHSPSDDSLEGEVIEVLGGPYEVAGYTEDGPSYLEEYIKVPELTEGMVINSEHDLLNVSVYNQSGQQVIILVPRNRVRKTN